MTSGQAKKQIVLRSETAALAVVPGAPSGWSIALSDDGETSDDGFSATAPLAVELVTADGSAQWLAGTYTETVIQNGALVCAGEVLSPNGTVFRFSDTYTIHAGGGFQMARTVLVAACGKGDVGFSTRFGLRAQTPLLPQDADFFVPGIWYKNNAHAPSGALAANPADRHFLFREDRLPLPLIAFRRKNNGLTLALLHVGGVPATFAGEEGRTRIIDARMQFGSVGFINDGTAETAFQMPGTEGERTYVSKKSPDEDTWARRAHPVLLAFTHRYKVWFQISRTPDFAHAVRQTWRASVALTRPPVVRADLNRVYRASGDLLNIYCRRYNGIISVPFQAKVPSGDVIDTSSQMGFVGQALPAAALLLRYGQDTRNADAIARSKEAVDFWVLHGMTPDGIPRNWYDIHKDGTFSWRNYPIYLRIASDGVGGALAAWNTARRTKQDKPEWLRFCRRYGDWLTRAQNHDGSFFRSYEMNGTPRDRGLNTTSHPIAFLCDLFCATGDANYKNAALRAGRYCYETVHRAYGYVGGTPDNPNVTDKEAGVMAFYAFLALHDVSGGESRWLDAATQAAYFSHSWVYEWNVPLPPGAKNTAFPATGKRTTHGLSLIAAGHSGADNYMASAPFLFYRLYLLTGDRHFCDAAHRLMHNTKQMVNWDNALGYKYPGLLTEAIGLASPRGAGVMGWLPWLTVALMEPMVRLRDVFGAWDIEQIEKLPLGERLRRNQAFARHRGFG